MLQNATHRKLGRIVNRCRIMRHTTRPHICAVGGRTRVWNTTIPASGNSFGPPEYSSRFEIARNFPAIMATHTQHRRIRRPGTPKRIRVCDFRRPYGSAARLVHYPGA